MSRSGSEQSLMKLLAMFSGRVEEQEKAAGVPLDEHFEAYKVAQTARGLVNIRKAGYVLRRLAKECGWQSLADFTGAGLEDWLTIQAANGMSPGNRNAYRTEVMTFANWCVRTHRLLENPFTLVPRANAKADPRRKRRALTEAELGRLLYVARWRPLAERGRQCQKRIKGKPRSKHSRRTWMFADVTYEGLEAAVEVARERFRRSRKLVRKLDDLGCERQLIYKTLALTGLRRGELASLTVGQFDLNGKHPCVVLNAVDEKNREGNSIPLRADLAAEIREWIDRKSRTVTVHANTPVFSVPQHLLRAMNKDLAVAGIPKRDDRGRTVDIHALRYSFATLLSQAGVAPRVAQAAMRHSTIDLTMNVYTDERLLNVQGALALLPELRLNGKPAAVVEPKPRRADSKSPEPAPSPPHEPEQQPPTKKPNDDAEKPKDDALSALASMSPDDLAALLRLAKAFGKGG